MDSVWTRWDVPRDRGDHERVLASRFQSGRAGILGSTLIAALFTMWNAAVTSVSLITHFWSAQQPGYHFGLSALVGAIPLGLGAWLIGRR